MSLRTAILLTICISLPTLAHGDTIVQTFEVDWTDQLGGPAEFMFDPFDTDNGARQLSGITLEFEGELDLEFAVQNFSALELEAHDWYYDGGANIIVAFSEKPGYEDGGPFYGLGGVYRSGVTGRLSAGSGGTPFSNPTAGEIEVVATVGDHIDSTVATAESSFPYFIDDQPLLAKMSPFSDFVLTPPLEDPSAFISAEIIELVQTGTLTLTYEYVPGLGRPEDCNGDGQVDILDVDCTCVETHVPIEDVLAAAGLAQGDLDSDGAVGFSDFAVLSQSFGELGNYSQGDFDCSGTVDFHDFVILAANFDTFEVMASSVSEPSAGLLFLLSLFALRPYSRQRESR